MKNKIASTNYHFYLNIGLAILYLFLWGISFYLLTTNYNRNVFLSATLFLALLLSVLNKKPLSIGLFNKHFWASLVLGSIVMLAVPHIDLLKSDSISILHTHYSINWATFFMVIACMSICFLIPDCNLKHINFFYRCIISAANTVFMMLGMSIGHELGVRFYATKSILFCSMIFIMSLFSAIGFVILLKLARSIHELLHYEKKSV